MKKILIKLSICFALVNTVLVQIALAQSAPSCPAPYSEQGRTSTDLTCSATQFTVRGSNDITGDADALATNLEGICAASNGTANINLTNILDSLNEFLVQIQVDATCVIALSETPETPNTPNTGSPGSGSPAPPAPGQAPKGPGNVSGKITDNPLIIPGSYEFTVGTAIENLCPQLAFRNNPLVAGSLTAAQKDLLVRCGDVIFEGNDITQKIGVQNMSSEEFSSQSVNLRRLNKAQLGNIAARLAALRPALAQASQDLAANDGVRHPLPGFAGIAAIKQRGGAAGDDDISEDVSRVGIFINGIYSDGEKDETDRSTGFDFSSTGYTVGVDYLVDLNTVVGVALGYGSSDTDFSRNGGSLDTDTTTISVYGTRFINDSWFLDGVIGYGTSDYTSKRNFDYTARGVTVNQTATGSPEANQLLISVGAGKSINKQSVDIDLTGRLNYLDATIDRFAESINGGSAPGFGLAIEIDDQDITSFTSDLSVRVSKAISKNFGVLIPQVSLAWLHEFDDGEDSLRGRFVNDPFSVDFSQSGLNTNGIVPTIFEVPLDDSDSDYGRLGVGVNVLLSHGLSINFQANKLLGLEDIDLEYYVLGIRKDL